jgi:AbrB family looped-hinge helix DNA binding protein
MTSTLTQAGQTTIPADIRRTAGWEPGATLDWQVDGGKVVVRLMVPTEEAQTVRLVRKGGKLVFPAGFKASSTAIADAIREERDSR